MFYILGISLLMLWSLGFLFPYTITGFIGILLMTASLNYLQKKIIMFKPIKIRLYKILRLS
ncbi:MAG: hypothetical protein EHM47_10255 [Ignavibacteriales bacterium]|nr:MAG: hypothetical protein EHM47_10255 [Ignavibacteriales bacterium]